MKYAAILIVLAALFVIGCSDSADNDSSHPVIKSVEVDNPFVDISKSGHQTFIMKFVDPQFRGVHPNITTKSFRFFEKADGVEVLYFWEDHEYYVTKAGEETETRRNKAGRWTTFVDNKTLREIVPQN